MGALICDACKGKGQIHVGGYAPFGPVQQWKTCPVCGGSGAIPYVDKDDTLKKCPACQGEGVLDEERESFYSDGSLKPARVCPVCKGKGVAIMGGAWLSHYYLCLIRFDSALWELEYLNKELLYSYDKLDKSKSAGDAGSTRKWDRR